ncbi:thioesterase [Virgibacillus massiliensis]|nr:thioesterase [Virgibacillus massiliensis]
MNDAEYGRVFSWAVDRLMKLAGIDDSFRETEQYTMYTLETHICYLAEMEYNEPLEVHVQLLDYDAKRIHVFFELMGLNGKRAASSEQMLMGMNQATGKPSPFPDQILSKVKELASMYTPAEKPKEAGRVIGIRKK